MTQYLLVFWAAVSLLQGCLSVAEEDQGQLSDPEDGFYKNYPCPPADQILPCICTHTNVTMEMDCSAVRNEDELKDIFHSKPPFPYDHFTKFIMDSNENVRELEYGVLNTIRFDEIEITNCALIEIQRDAFIHSADTLKKLTLYNNRIERFLMVDNPDMSSFTQLWRLHLGGNNIGVFPDIKSHTITELLLNDNPIHTLHEDNLQRLHNLEKIDISEINMEELDIHLLNKHEKLIQVYLNNNKLAEINSKVLKIHSLNLKRINLGYNRISYVSPNAFDDNPLECGCDLKWMFVPEAGDDTDYIGAMHGATCPNNDVIPISELDPSWFEQFC